MSLIEGEGEMLVGDRFEGEEDEIYMMSCMDWEVRGHSLGRLVNLWGCI